MLYEAINVAIMARRGLHRIQYIRTLSAQVVFDEAARFHGKRAEIAELAQMMWEMDFQKIPGDSDITEELFEQRIVLGE